MTSQTNISEQIVLTEHFGKHTDQFFVPSLQHGVITFFRSIFHAKATQSKSCPQPGRSLENLRPLRFKEQEEGEEASQEAVG
jgi:hypothetical protein